MAELLSVTFPPTVPMTNNTAALFTVTALSPCVELLTSKVPALTVVFPV